MLDNQHSGIIQHSDIIQSLVQGQEAGGHGRRFASTLTFVPEAVDLVVGLCKAMAVARIPVLAAGGISDARQVCLVHHAFRMLLL